MEYYTVVNNNKRSLCRNMEELLKYITIPIPIKWNRMQNSVYNMLWFALKLYAYIHICIILWKNLKISSLFLF